MSQTLITEMKMVSRQLIVMIIVATLLTVLLGNIGLNMVKVAGSGLALLVFLPVFLILKRQIASGDSMNFIKTFVLGFFFKLIVLLVVFWLAISKLSWDTTDFIVGNMVFLIILQAYESVYFMKMQKNNDQEHPTA